MQKSTDERKRGRILYRELGYRCRERYRESTTPLAQAFVS